MNETFAPRVLGLGIHRSEGCSGKGILRRHHGPRDTPQYLCPSPRHVYYTVMGIKNTTMVQARGRAWNLLGSTDVLLEGTNRGKRQRKRITGHEVARSLLSPNFPWVFRDSCDPGDLSLV